MEGKKFISDFEKLKVVLEAWRTLGYTIVWTMGSWDLLHIGHARYLEAASKQGGEKTILVVGVDSDRVVTLSKGPTRPIIPQDERVEMLSYLWFVNYVTFVDDVDEQGKWTMNFLGLFKPDIIVTVEDSYSEKERKALENHCGKVVVLPRQAENTSSTVIVQGMVKKHIEQILELLNRRN